MASDPVCGMFVEESENTLHATVRGTTYYFCSETCLKTFTEPERQLKTLKRNIAIGVILSIPIIILEYLWRPPGLSLVADGLILLVLTAPVQFISGWRFYRGTYDAIKMRSSNMDILIAVGTSAAFFYSVIYIGDPNSWYFDTATVIITLILVGKLLEEYVRGKASDAVRKLLALQPPTARRIRADGTEEDVPLNDVAYGDILLIKPGEKVPTDGVVVEGHSSVDEKMVTGESIPVEKETGNPVIGATINGTGSLKIKATRVGSDTTLSKIIKVVEDAQASKGPIERLANRVATYFVPVVIAVALASFGLWSFAGRPFSFGFTTAVAVLIIACPCALGLATPAAVMTGAGKGAENGILIKGGEYLERMQKINTIVFDKTGTLTKGKPSVTDVVELSGIPEDEVIKMAAIAEKQSEHPLATAILERAKGEFGEKGVPDPDSFESITGQGIKASYKGSELIFGNTKVLDTFKIALGDEGKQRLSALRKDGKTAMVLAADGKVAGIVAVADTLKDHAVDTVNRLKQMKIEPVMLTGDNAETAAAIARQAGIERYFAEVLPAGKADVVKQLQKEEHRIVAMVGDGINDAPALAQADIGIAMGSGSDIAVETGGLILMRDDVRDVVSGIQLSRKTMGKVKQNLGWAFGYNIALIPVAAGVLYLATGVLLNPIFAAVAMALSSVSVTTNSLTLRRFKPKL